MHAPQWREGKKDLNVIFGIKLIKVIFFFKKGQFLKATIKTSFFLYFKIIKVASDSSSDPVVKPSVDPHSTTYID